MVRECAEELGFPAALASEQDFRKAVSSIDLKIVGILKEVEFNPSYESIRKLKDGEEYKSLFMTTYYIGYYDGAIRFVDGESSGIEVFSLEELENELKTNPDKFTEDIKYMIKKFKKYLVPIN